MSWDYDDDQGGPVELLDDVFKHGNAPRLHGMLRSLDAMSHMPDRTPPRYVVTPQAPISGGNREYRSTEDSGGIMVMYDEHSILQGSARDDAREDLSVEQFFYHADILSGQDVGGVPDHANELREKLKVESGGWAGRAVDCIEASRTGAPSHVGPSRGALRDGRRQCLAVLE